LRIEKFLKFVNVNNTLIESSTDFSFQTQFFFFGNLFELPATTKTHSKIQYLPHFSFENYEINSIKSDSPRTFQQQPQQHERMLSNSNTFFFIFYFI